MKNIKIDSRLNAEGTSFHGTVIPVNPRAFSQFMGADHVSDDYKISREWICRYKGKVYCIYDWKSTDLYAKGLYSVKDFWSKSGLEELHIGSKSSMLEEQEFLEELLMEYKRFISITKIVGE